MKKVNKEEIVYESELFLKHIEDYDIIATSKYNPYYKVGIAHNDCLKYLLSKKDKLSPEEFTKASFKFLTQSDGGFVKSYDSSFIEKLSLLTNTLTATIKETNRVSTDLIDLIGENKIFKAEMYWLLESILHFDSNKHSLVDRVNDLNNWEFRIRNMKIEESISIPLLIAGAVARYSTSFWTENQYSSRSKKPKNKKKCLKTVFTIAADVIGAAGGAVAGLFLGGPGGAIAGGIVVGGAMSAAGSQIIK